MKKMMILLPVLILAVCAMVMASTYTVVCVHVKPSVSVSLTAPTSYYNFGTVALNKSTQSGSAVEINNNGEVNVTLEQQMIYDDDWDVSASSYSKDGFDLFIATAATVPAIGDFPSGTPVEITALNTVKNLTGIGAAQAELAKDQTANIWFKLNMPVDDVTDDDAVRFDIEIRATAK